MDLKYSHLEDQAKEEVKFAQISVTFILLFWTFWTIQNLKNNFVEIKKRGRIGNFSTSLYAVLIYIKAFTERTVGYLH